LSEIRSFEPWWKLILGNKAILPLLWSEFPNHPNLLPAFFENPLEVISSKYETRDNHKSDSITEIEKLNWVSKPLYGREGIGIL